MPQPSKRRTETLDYYAVDARSTPDHGRYGTLRHARLPDRDGLCRSERHHPWQSDPHMSASTSEDRPPIRSASDGRIGKDSETAPPEWRSSRPARSSSSRIMKICAGCSPVWRISSSTPTGVGPSASTTRSRSESPAGGVAEKSGGSSKVAGSGIGAARQRRDGLDDVAGLGHQDRALLEQPVGAGGARIERRAGHGEDQPAHFAGEPRADQRARALRRLDHHQPERQPGDDPVAARKILRARLPAERHFRDGRAAASAISSARPTFSGG